MRLTHPGLPSPLPAASTHRCSRSLPPSKPSTPPTSAATRPTPAPTSPAPTPPTPYFARPSATSSRTGRPSWPRSTPPPRHGVATAPTSAATPTPCRYAPTPASSTRPSSSTTSSAAPSPTRPPRPARTPARSATCSRRGPERGPGRTRNALTTGASSYYGDGVQRHGHQSVAHRQHRRPHPPCSRPDRADRRRRRLTGRSPGQAPSLIPLEEAQLLRRIRHQQVLRLLIVIQHHPVVLPPDPRLLVAAESGVRRVGVVAVRPDAARLDRSARAVRLAAVAGPDLKRRGRTGCRSPCGSRRRSL